MDANFPSAERVLVMQALHDVNSFTGQESIVLDPSAQCSIVARSIGPHPDGGPILGRRQQDEGVWLDLESIRNRDDVGGDPDRYRALVRVVATHEFLHAVGLDHHKGEGIMNSAANPENVFTAADREECRSVGLCR